PRIDALLKAGTASLRKAGYRTRSAFLTSPTFGGGSWLPHSTMGAGVWVTNPARYPQFTTHNHFTLSEAFERGGWRTVFDLPATTGPWPVGQRIYHYDTLYESTNVGYAGPHFNFAKIPDQYTLNVLDQRELSPPGRQPLFAEVVLD